MSAAGTSVSDALRAATDAIAAAGSDSPRLDAEVLLAEALGADRSHLLAEPEERVAGAAARRFAGDVRRRVAREPVAYIIGRKGFRQIELTVDRRVLVPRPETELLVEIALELRPATMLDVGTGSGAIALAVADELPQTVVVATDTSPEALEVARANAERLGLADRIEFLEESVPSGRSFDLVLANLPYVSPVEWASLQPEITKFEPRKALLAGDDGLDAFRSVLVAVDCDAIALEIGAGQARAVTELAAAAGFARTEVRKDLAGHDRVVLAYAAPTRSPRTLPPGTCR